MKTKIINKFIIFAVIILLISLFWLFLPSSLFALDFTLNPGDDIQAAVNSALSNADTPDNIYLNPGNYTNLYISINISPGKTLNIIGSGANNTILENNYGGNLLDILGGGTVNVSNLTIRESSRAMFNNGSSVNFDNCYFINNTHGDLGGALYYTGGLSSTITNCVFTGNVADGGGAIYIVNSASQSVYNCKFSGNNYTTWPYEAIWNNQTNWCNAENNWWGSSSGPYNNPLNISGTGDSVSLYVDFDPWLTSDPFASASKKTVTEPVWVRTMPMTCYRVWINGDNKFQFIFWYPYRDNNWVKIYDMSGKEVFSINMPYDNPNLIVDLPNGMYTVKTFTAGSTSPIQTFVIGK